MNKLILDIYHGNFEALESAYQSDAREIPAMIRSEELEIKLKTSIPEECHSLLSDCHNAFMKVVDAVAEEAFLEGYRMGVQLMLAAWPNK